MGIAAIIAILVVMFISYGARGIFLKLAQNGRVSTLQQALVYTTLYSALQAVVLLVAPPYPSLICEAEFYIYPLAFSVFYILGYIFLIMALSEGSTGITNTINSFNCLVPVFFGFVVWKEELSVWKIIGLFLFVLGLIIYNRSSYSVEGVKQKISPKWLWHTLMSVVFMGIAVIFTKMAMREYPAYDEQYLIYYALLSVIIGGVLMLFLARDQIKPLFFDWKFVLFVGIAATAFDVNNYIFVNFINKLHGAFFLPFCSVMGMVSVLICSRIFLKEKISRSAIISSAICIAAIAFLNF